MQNVTSVIKYAAAGVAVLAAAYVLTAGIASSTSSGWYEPPQLEAGAADQDKAKVIAQGVTFGLDDSMHSGIGWLPNDLMWIPSIIDNATAYQRGIIYATRPASDIAAKTAARFGTRDTLDARLADATSRYFTYGENVWGFWFIYDAEGKYQAGIKGWQDWAASVGSGAKNAGIYNIKSDDVYNILKYCSTLTDYALGILNNEKTGHFSADNNIYYAKGIALVAGNMLRAVTAVDPTIRERGGDENLNEALQRFQYIHEFNPLLVFAGGNVVGDAMLPNHVAALARHLDVANSRINDMLNSLSK